MVHHEQGRTARQPARLRLERDRRRRPQGSGHELQVRARAGEYSARPSNETAHANLISSSLQPPSAVVPVTQSVLQLIIAATSPINLAKAEPTLVPML